jgi:sulfur-oxidizing protein SoxA
MRQAQMNRKFLLALCCIALAGASLVAAAPTVPAEWWRLGEPSAKPADSRAQITQFYRRLFPSLSLQDYALGSGALNKELRQQDAELASFSPAGFVLDKGAKLWRQPFPDGKSYASCYPAGGKGVAARYPYYSEPQHEVVTLPISLNACRKQHGLPPLPYGKPEIVALETYLASLSNGMPLRVEVDSAGAAAAFQAGQKLFFQPEGQLGLACASCHFGAVGHYLRAQLLSPALGMTVTFPKYRMKWSKVGTLDRRFRGCQTNIRAKPQPFESTDYRNLEFFLAYLSDGIKIDVPGNGP